MKIVVCLQLKLMFLVDIVSEVVKLRVEAFRGSIYGFRCHRCPLEKGGARELIEIAPHRKAWPVREALMLMKKTAFQGGTSLPTYVRSAPCQLAENIDNLDT